MTAASRPYHHVLVGRRHALPPILGGTDFSLCEVKEFA
jgi:hypothetical protein